MTPLENYLRELRDIRNLGAGVPETSHYSPLANLLNEVGRHLKPKVRCVMTLANRGAGLPDGGLFAPPDSTTTPTYFPWLPGGHHSNGSFLVDPTGISEIPGFHTNG